MSRRHTAEGLRQDGSRHYSKQQLREREAAEPRPPEAYIIVPPSYLTPRQQEEFMAVAPTLKAMGVLTELDGDNLARYLVARSNYLRATNRVTAALNSGDLISADRWAAIQDRFFKQCRAAGADVGLSAASRAGIAVKRVLTEISVSDDLFGD